MNQHDNDPQHHKQSVGSKIKDTLKSIPQALHGKPDSNKEHHEHASHVHSSKDAAVHDHHLFHKTEDHHVHEQPHHQKTHGGNDSEHQKQPVGSKVKDALKSIPQALHGEPDGNKEHRNKDPAVHEPHMFNTTEGHHAHEQPHHQKTHGGVFDADHDKTHGCGHSNPGGYSDVLTPDSHVKVGTKNDIDQSHGKGSGLLDKLTPDSMKNHKGDHGSHHESHFGNNPSYDSKTHGKVSDLLDKLTPESMKTHKGDHGSHHGSHIDAASPTKP